jgi:hypothetical protein
VCGARINFLAHVVSHQTTVRFIGGGALLSVASFASMAPKKAKAVAKASVATARVSRARTKKPTIIVQDPAKPLSKVQDEKIQTSRRKTDKKSADELVRQQCHKSIKDNLPSFTERFSR